MENKIKQTAKAILKRERVSSALSSEHGLLIIMVVLILTFSFSTTSFASVNNLLNITRQVSIVLIVSLGMLSVVLSGEIDLSVGSVAAFAGVTSAIVMIGTNSVFVGVAVALLFGMTIGLTNGLLVVYGKIPSFIVSLSMMWIVRGMALVWTSGRAVSNLPRSFAFLGAGYIGVVPVSTILCGILVIIAYIVLHKTKHGVYYKSIGSNLEAAKLSAIPIKPYKISVFIVSGALAALGGIITTSKLLSAQAIANEGMEMDVLAAVILGGASLSGGIGTVIGTLIGALTIGIINNGMNQLGISAFFQQIVKGTIILVAVLIRQRNKK
ncbi:MAG: ABC transporter permease [Bacteroidia bacterium]|jgi:ribose transport system permease protein|nr:ABC transporter permease [Bacteroidia bacterium]